MFFNTDIQAADPSIAGSIAWSMGCHAGYNVPDDAVPPLPEYSKTIPDFPQALAAKGGTWIANTGYGYGTDDGIAGSERLMVYLTQELGRDFLISLTKPRIGVALRNAKLRYLQDLPQGGLTPYDAKSIMEATLYGLPMYIVNVPNSLDSSDYVPPINVTEVATMPLSFDLLAQQIEVVPELILQSGNTGEFFSLGMADAMWAHGTAGRPLLPSGSVPLPPLPEGDYWQPRGVLFLSGGLTPFEDFDPVITRPVSDTAMTEPRLEGGLGWSSPQLFTINRFGDGSGRLAATFALFNARSSELRLLTNAIIEVLYTRLWNNDFTPPRILTARAMRITGSPTVELEATAADAEGRVTRFYFTFITPDQVWSVPLEPDLNDPSGQSWLGTTSNIPAGARYVLQAVDGAGNVAMAMNKGDYIPLNSEIRFVYLPLVLRESIN
jgi:hypothetical protein